MKCFGVELKQTNSKLKLKAVGQEVKLSTTNIPSNIKLGITHNEIKFNLTPLIHLIKLKTKGLNNLLALNIYNSIVKLIKLDARIDNQIVLNFTRDKLIKWNIRGLENILLVINRDDNIILICIADCKHRRKYDYLRSLDDEWLIDTEDYLLKSIIDYGRERFN